MEGRFFVSYRRDDSAGFAGRLADSLEASFGVGSVFRDVDDIPPGRDYVEVINERLRQAQAVLVLIGPRWLEADAAGKRRIDASDDFVCAEIAAALSARTPLIPLLLSDAKMPDAKALPETIAGLARHQAMCLSDAEWRGDVERLTQHLRLLAGHDATTPPPQPPSNRRRWLVAGLVVVLIAVIGVVTATRFYAAKPAAPTAAASPDISQLTGRWQAHVKYDWGDEYDESFSFKPMANGLLGTASFLGGRLAIENAKLDGEWLSFSTTSRETLGSDSEAKEVTHRYIGQVTADRIQFTLESKGGYSVHTPVEFVARRDANAMAAPPPTAKD